MINTNFFINTLRFTLLLVVQILVFNRLNFFGFINPMVYLLFLFWFPIKENRAVFIGLSFLLGLAVDIFSDTLAFHAAATVTIAYLRPAIMRFVFGINLEFQSFKLSNTTRAQQFTFLALLITVHHFIFFTLEIFSFANVLIVVKKVVSTTIATLILCMLFNTLFSVEKE